MTDAAIKEIKVPKVRRSFRLDGKLLDRLAAVAAYDVMNETAVVTQALKEYLRERERVIRREQREKTGEQNRWLK